MSASEKLRVLDEVLREWPNGFLMSRMKATSLAISVLPLIADVVEAAEDAADHFIDQSAHDHGWPIELKSALTALDDALRGDDAP